MILIDANVPMYLVGAEHPSKHRARELVERAIVNRERLVTDAEVLREILHRYVAINRRDAIEPAMNALLGFTDEVLPIELEDVRRAGRMLPGGSLSARDALHFAIMQRHGIDRIMSFDRAFDGIPGLTRLA